MGLLKCDYIKWLIKLNGNHNNLLSLYSKECLKTVLGPHFFHPIVGKNMTLTVKV